jgi:hypothetical protein
MPLSRSPHRPARHALLSALLVLSATTALASSDCSGTPQASVGGSGVAAWKLAGGGFAAWSAMNINIDGYGRAYHRKNREAGAVLHLCVGGEVFLPDGTRYQGSASQATCTGRFMDDLARIEAAGWTDPSVGVVQWYGVLAEGEATVAGRKVKGIKPVVQGDGSGFYVSPTSLVDRKITDLADQRRYVNPLRVASAVVPSRLVRAGVPMGSFGVAMHSAKKLPVPFVVGDGGPRIGEGSPALARLVGGLPLTDEMTLRNRYAGQVDGKSVLWVFFGGPAMAYDHTQEADVAVRAQAAFEAWGGVERLTSCAASLPRP